MQNPDTVLQGLTMHYSDGLISFLRLMQPQVKLNLHIETDQEGSFIHMMSQELQLQIAKSPQSVPGT